MLSLLRNSEQAEEGALKCLFNTSTDDRSNPSRKKIVQEDGFMTRWAANSYNKPTRENQSAITSSYKTKEKHDKIKRKTGGVNLPKFYHFEKSHDYIVYYRENVTYHSILEYRQALEALKQKKNPNAPQNVTKSLEECRTPSQCDTRKTSFIDNSLLKDCTPKYTSVYGVNIKIIMQQVNMKQERSKGSARTSASPKKKVKPSSAFKFTEKLDRRYNERYSPQLVKKSKNSKSKNTIRLKTGNDCSSPLTILSNSNVVIGPRMGSNHPIQKDRTINGKRQLTPSQRYASSLRPRVPQAAIPNKNNTFQACIMPMSV